MTVRCIYGGTIQETAEEKGLKEWCDRNCAHLGMERGHICYDRLRRAGVFPENEHKK